MPWTTNIYNEKKIFKNLKEDPHGFQNLGAVRQTEGLC